MWDALASIISEKRGRPFQIAGSERLGGGCINAACRLEGEDGSRYFVKTNDAARESMFATEAAALEAIAATGTIRVPRPVAHGVEGEQAYLVLEYIETGRRGDAAEMGRQLAALHRHRAERFGWDRDNTIGETPQPNPWTDDWIEFYREQRLRFQLELAASRGMRFRGVDRLLDGLERWFGNHKPVPSLLHGDLWGGNAGFTTAGEPLLYDPASYYGDREADLAMTELFGGFSADFYGAYDEAWPRDPGYRKRINLYNLYHVLNHANLFGGSYGSQAQRMISELGEDR